MDNLILVESPTKARTLTRFLGSDFRIEATMGHVRDLPKKKLGVDVLSNFTPEYVVSEGKQKKVEELKALAKSAKKIILATDPDREGEAIAWHVAALIAPNSRLQLPSATADGGQAKLQRIVFHEITESAIKEALAHPGTIDMNLVDAQQARRILDRLVGYKLSPLLWRKVRRGLSAGRVQSVALRLIVERKREIEKFVPVEYWEIEAELQKKLKAQNSELDENSSQIFKAKLSGKIEVKNKEEADKILKDLEGGVWKVDNITQKEVRKNPYPPFMTSTLQQGAGNRFGWSTKKTMQIAQSLYEEGYISYHRTDSLNLSQEAIGGTRSLVEKMFGKEYLSDAPRVYKTKSKVAQEAHEAIRPTDFSGLESFKEVINKDLGREAAKLYELIWKRTIATQMKEALFEATSVDIIASSYLFRGNGLKMIFDGWKKLFEYNNEEGKEEREGAIPELVKDEILKLKGIVPSQHFTEALPDFTEASLVKALEEKGIGRPSTYAPIISTILERQYVEKVEKKLQPTALGFAVNDFLVVNFPDIMDFQFTARMEEELDEIARGERKWESVLAEFYEPFEKNIKEKTANAERVKIAVEETKEKCELCGSMLVVRIGRFGRFLACSRFPECKFTKPYIVSTGLTCPKCQGNIILRRTKKGKHFYGCANYPKCDFASWTKPIK